MKAHSQGAGSWDRMATHEELSQIVELADGILASENLACPQTDVWPMVLGGEEMHASTEDGWLDGTEEIQADQSLDTTLESLAEIFVDQNDFVN